MSDFLFFRESRRCPIGEGGCCSGILSARGQFAGRGPAPDSRPPPSVTGLARRAFKLSRKAAQDFSRAERGRRDVSRFSRA